MGCWSGVGNGLLGGGAEEGLAGSEQELLAGLSPVVGIGPFKGLVFAFVEDKGYLRIDALGKADAMGVVFGGGKDEVV